VEKCAEVEVCKTLCSKPGDLMLCSLPVIGTRVQQFFLCVKLCVELRVKLCECRVQARLVGL